MSKRSTAGSFRGRTLFSVFMSQRVMRDPLSVSAESP
jgi:hypothetical protein